MIKGCIGRGGAGKSFYTVGELHKLFRKGAEIISNTPLIDLRVRHIIAPNGRYMPVPVDPIMFGHSWASAYIMRFAEIYDLTNCEVLVDELGVWAPASEWQSMPSNVKQFLAQDRKEGVNVHWTARTDRVFVDVRENTAQIAKCRRWLEYIIEIRLIDPQEPDEKPVRLFRTVNPNIYDLYDTFAVVGKAGRPKKGEVDETVMKYRQGGRRSYSDNMSPYRWVSHLPTVGGDTLVSSIRLRWSQAWCLMRKFGAESIGLRREENFFGVYYGRCPESSVELVKMADDPELLELRGFA